MPIRYLYQPKDMPVLFMTDCIATMSATYQVGRLYGGLHDSDVQPALATFWDKFRMIFPSFSGLNLFATGDADPRRTVPCVVHTDEGRP